MNDTVFFSVLYPGVEIYLDDYLASLARQSCQEFDLFFANDGLQDIGHWIEKYPTLSITVQPFIGSPAKIRGQGIRQLIFSGYEYAIFGDADDFFAKNRVEVSRAMLQEFDIVVSDLTLADARGHKTLSNYISHRYADRAEISLQEIEGKNLFGFSNTAIRLGTLPFFSFPDDLVAVDWFFFTLLLMERKRAVFTNKTETFYRQHGENTVGMGRFTEEGILRAVDVKKDHYEALQHASGRFRQLYSLFVSLKQKLATNEWRVHYIESVNDITPAFPLWWEVAREECC